MAAVETLYCFGYVEHKGSEPRQDFFRFQVRDTSANQSPPVQLDIVIEVRVIYMNINSV